MFIVLLQSSGNTHPCCYVNLAGLFKYCTFCQNMKEFYKAQY